MSSITPQRTNEKITEKSSKTPAAAGQTQVVTPDEAIPSTQLDKINPIPISFPDAPLDVLSQVADLQQQVSTLKATVATQAAAIQAAAMENKCLLNEKSRSEELYSYSQIPSSSYELLLDEDENSLTLLDSSTIDKIFFLAAHGFTPSRKVRLGVKLVENEAPDKIRSAPPGFNHAIQHIYTQFVDFLLTALISRTPFNTIIKGFVVDSLDCTKEKFDQIYKGTCDSDFSFVVAQGMVDEVLIKRICRVDLIAALICEFLLPTWISPNTPSYCIGDGSDSEFEEENDDEEDSSDNDDDSLSDNPDDDDDDEEEDEEAVFLTQYSIDQALQVKLKQKQSVSKPLIPAIEQEDIKDVDKNVQRIYDQIRLSTLCAPPTPKFDSYVKMTVPTLHCVPACLVARRLTDFLKKTNNRYQLEDNMSHFLSGIIDKWLVHQTRMLLQQIDLDRSLGSLTMLMPQKAED